MPPQTTPHVLIETPRLVLRTVTMEDVEAVALNWELYDGPISRAEAEKQVQWMLENHQRIAPGKVSHLCLAVIIKEDQELIGWCGLDHMDAKRPNPVLFYLLKEAWWGRGLATEAARALLKYAFGDLCLERIDGSCAWENAASRLVMEKIGMQYLGLDAAGGHSFTIARECFSDTQAGKR